MMLWTFTYVCFCEHILISLRNILWSEICESVGRCYLTWLEAAKLFLQWLYRFTFPLEVCEGSNYSVSLTTLDSVYVQKNSFLFWWVCCLLLFTSLLTLLNLRCFLELISKERHLPGRWMSHDRSELSLTPQIQT